VGVEHGIKLGDLFAQRLFTKVRRGVDQDMAGIVVRITVAERQTAQSQPIVGTPIDVPLPNTVRVACISRLYL
jgi:hypothetical protein